MTLLYWIILIAFIITCIFLIRSMVIKYCEQNALKKASEKISDGYLIFSSAGRITNYNKTILCLLNLKENDVKDKNIYNVFNENNFKKEDITAIKKKLNEIKNNNEALKLDIKLKNNKKIFKIEIKSIVNNDIFLRYAIIFKDITNTYQVIEKLHQNQDMMANKEKFSTLGQLISRNCSFIKITNYFYI